MPRVWHYRIVVETAEQSPFAELGPAVELLPSRDMQFGIRSALKGGNRMVTGRQEDLEVRTKIDLTLVSKIDLENNVEFNADVATEYKGQAEVHGEEISQAATAEPMADDEPRIKWTIDSVDGTVDYVATYRDKRTGEPIDPTQPIPEDAEPELIQDHERTCCIGLAMFKGRRPQLGIAYNPFKRELVIADRDLGGTFLVDLDALEGEGVLRGWRLHVSDQPFVPGPAPWDQAVWAGAPVDTLPLQEAAVAPPRRKFSAISQAVDVARRRSVAAVFAGNTLHDIAPAALIVYWAGGIIAKPDGTIIHLDDLLDNLDGGFVYTNVAAHTSFMRALRDGPQGICFIDHDGVLAPARFGPLKEDALLAEDVGSIVRLVAENTIIIRSFGFEKDAWLTKAQARQLGRFTRRFGASPWRYDIDRHSNELSTIGRIVIESPDQLTNARLVQNGEQSPPLTSSQLILTALRFLVMRKLARRPRPAVIDVTDHLDRYT